MQINQKRWHIIRLIIFVLAAATVVVIAIAALHNKAEKEPAQKLEEIPEIVVETMPKCLLLSADENGVFVLWQGEQQSLEWDADYQVEEPIGANTVADVTLTNGKVTALATYTQKINAKLIEIKEAKDGTKEIELAEYGVRKATSDLQVYKLFGSVESYALSDLIIGYAFTDFVLNEEGQVVAALAMQQEEMDKIRVLIKTDNFEASIHERLELSCDSRLTVVAQTMQETALPGVTESSLSSNEGGQENRLLELAAGEKLELTAESELFADVKRIALIPEALSGRIRLLSLARNQGTPAYYGIIEIEKTDEGLVVVNEVPLEEYLYSVVPSEMPASYPAEALKAQAVCARTYAYVHMLHAGLQRFGAHVDDSAAFQVYNNIAENGETTIAVRDTEGKIMYHGEEALTAYFYSTSCGLGTDLSAWNLKYEDTQAATDGYLIAGRIASDEGEKTDFTQEEAFSAYIRSVDEASYEKNDTYYRWRYQTNMNTQVLLENLQKRYERDPEDILTRVVDENEGAHFSSEPIRAIGEVLSIEICKRSVGGVATELLLTGTEQTILVRGEQNIRYTLANEETTLMLGADYGKEGKISGMLPSSFLTLEITKAAEEAEQAEDTQMLSETENPVLSYTVYGGGFGHGIGMSQNGARAMAQAGKSCDEILQLFYQFEYK